MKNVRNVPSDYFYSLERIVVYASLQGVVVGTMLGWMSVTDITALILAPPLVILLLTAVVAGHIRTLMHLTAGVIVYQVVLGIIGFVACPIAAAPFAASPAGLIFVWALMGSPFSVLACSIAWGLTNTWRGWPVLGQGGSCARCDYDLTGNVSGRCPECGHA